MSGEVEIYEKLCYNLRDKHHVLFAEIKPDIKPLMCTALSTYSHEE